MGEREDALREVVLKRVQAMSRADVIKRIRDGLRRRSGKAWSVTGGRGTAYGWLRIISPPRRRPGGSMTDDDRAELGKLLGLNGPAHRQGVLVADSSAYYAEFIDRAEGVQPQILGEPYWD